MPSEKTTAIVLRVIDFSESSCILTLFTEDFGKISALAKGARRPKSPFESALDLLAVCRIVFLQKSGDVLDLLTEAKLERRFRSASRDLSRLYAGYYVAELLREMTDLGDQHPELYREAERTLSELDQGSEPASLIMRFELAALKLLGFAPSLDDCAVCGNPIEPIEEPRRMFGVLAGGLLCSRCRGGQQEVVGLGIETVERLRAFSDLQSETWRTLTWDRLVQGELRGVLNHYLANLLGRRPRMHDYLGLLRG